MPEIEQLITSPFSEADAETSYVLYTQGITHPVSIDGRPYVVDLEQSGRVTTAATRTGQDTSAIPGEQALNNEVYWTRVQESWVYGSGQRVFDSALAGVDDQISRQRMEEAWNVDLDQTEGIFLTDFIEETAAISLSGSQHIGGPSAVFTTNLIISASDTYAYFTDLDNTAVYRLNMSTGAVDACTSDAVGKQCMQLATDGEVVYLGCQTTGLVTIPIGSLVGTQVGGAKDYDAIFYANGFLFGGVGTKLQSIASSGTGTDLLDTDISGTWGTHGWASSPEFVYAVWCTSPGNRTTVYKINVKTDGTLGVPTVALPEMVGETIQCLLWHQGLMLIGTDLGFRIATIESGNLSPGPLIQVNRDKWTENFGVTQFAEYDGRVWFALQAIYNPRDNAVPGDLRMGTDSGVAVIDLGRAITPLQPAWREVWRNTDGTDSVAVVGGTKLCWASQTNATILTADASMGHPVTEGSFSTGWITFGIPWKKTFVDLVIEHDPLTDGQSIWVYQQAEDESDPSLLGISQIEGATQSEAMSPGQLNSNRIRLIFVLRGDVSAPDYRPTRLRRWRMRAYPSPTRADQIVLAVILHRKVRIGVDERQDFVVDELEEYQALADLVAEGTITTCRIGEKVDNVKLYQLQQKPNSWTVSEEGGFRYWNATVLVGMYTL